MKKKRKKTFLKKKKNTKIDERKKRKRGPKEVPPVSAQKNDFFKEMLQEILKQLRPKKSDFEQPRKEKEKEKKNEDK